MGFWLRRRSFVQQGVTNTAILIGDLNNDKKSDIIQAWRRGKNISFTNYISSGDGTFSIKSHNSNHGYKNIGMLIGDHNGDDKDDIIQLWNNPMINNKSNRMGIISHLKK